MDNPNTEVVNHLEMVIKDMNRLCDRLDKYGADGAASEVYDMVKRLRLFKSKSREGELS